MLIMIMHFGWKRSVSTEWFSKLKIGTWDRDGLEGYRAEDHRLKLDDQQVANVGSLSKIS